MVYELRYSSLTVGWSVQIGSFWSRLNDPDLGHRSRKKSEILVFRVSHWVLLPCQISSKSESMTQIFNQKYVDLTWNAPMVNCVTESVVITQVPYMICNIAVHEPEPFVHRLICGIIPYLPSKLWPSTAVHAYPTTGCQ